MMSLLVASLLLTQDASPQVARTHATTLKVIDRVVAADAIVAKTESLEGYFTERTEDGLLLRVPQAKLAELSAFVESQGTVLLREVATQDLAAQLENYKAIIATREQLLQRYLDALAKANGEGVVAIEREATRLVQEIESMKGALRLSEHQLALATLRVSFQFRDRTGPARDGHSSFKWLNTVNLADLLGAFQYEN